MQLADLIEDYVRDNLGEYIGDCSTGTPGPGSSDTGKWCSGVFDFTGEAALVWIGIYPSDVFADPVQVRKSSDGRWTIVAVGAPAAGTGLARAADRNSVYLAAGAVFVAGGVVLLLYLSRNRVTSP